MFLKLSNRTLIFNTALLSLGLLLLCISLGSSAVSLWDLFKEHHPQAQLIIFEHRLPRTLSAFVCGALLALAGSCLQLLLRNPLAEPYILGLSGGASTFAISALLLGLHGLSLHIAGFFGALFAGALVLVLSRHYLHNHHSHFLILCGVVLASCWGACSTLLFSLLDAPQLQQLIFWLAGDFSANNKPYWQTLILMGVFGVLYMHCNQLNLLRFGQTQAQLFGISIKKTHALLFVISSLATATAISLGGAIGFVGLIIPHAIRYACGSDHRLLLPLAVFLGGDFLMLADTFSRSAIPPYQLPVGAITALLGTPIFIVLLRLSWKTHHV